MYGSNGFIYTVLPGDTFYSIADCLNIPFSDLTDANPQITDTSRIIPGQQLRIPYVPPPIIGPIVLLDKAGQLLPSTDGVTLLARTTVIHVPLFRATHVIIIYTGKKGEVVPPTQLIGMQNTMEEAQAVDLTWSVPWKKASGYLIVIACNGRSCTTSDHIPIAVDSR